MKISLTLLVFIFLTSGCSSAFKSASAQRFPSNTEIKYKIETPSGLVAVVERLKTQSSDNEIALISVHKISYRNHRIFLRNISSISVSRQLDTICFALGYLRASNELTKIVPSSSLKDFTPWYQVDEGRGFSRIESYDATSKQNWPLLKVEKLNCGLTF